LPTSGSIVLDATNTTITFLATTPPDGVVSVHVPPLPTFDEMLFEPCP
jgi:hypothetical protein